MSSQPYSRQQPPKKLGQWLRDLRKQRGMPMREVAAVAAMDQAVLCKVELGQRLPTEEQMEKIAKLFGVDDTVARGRLAAAKLIQAHAAEPEVIDAAIDALREMAVYRTRDGK